MRPSDYVQAPYGIDACSVCGRNMTLTKAGRIRAHGRERDTGSRWAKCAGSYLEPARGPRKAEMASREAQVNVTVIPKIDTTKLAEAMAVLQETFTALARDLEPALVKLREYDEKVARLAPPAPSLVPGEEQTNDD